MRILYGVSPIGLGHAARAVAVGERLRAAGAEVTFMTGGAAADFLGSHGFEVAGIVTEPTPRVASGEMKDASLWYLRYWFGYRGSKRRVREFAAAQNPDLIAGDEEFSCIEVARETNTTHAMITDEMELGFARTWLARKIEARVDRWYQAQMRTTGLVIVPEEGPDSENIRHVGPIVREVTKSRMETLTELAIPDDSSVILLSLSGARVGRELIAETMRCVAGFQRAELVISGNTGRRVRAEHVHDLGVVRDNQNLVAAADLVISTAGKSTIDEALSVGAPIIAIPIKNHAEQERNAKALGFVHEDVNRLPSLIEERLGKRTTPRAFMGAAKTAELLLRVAG